MSYTDHDEDCDKINYEGGICTCYMPSSPDGSGLPSYRGGEASDAASERAMEDYEGPALDW